MLTKTFQLASVLLVAISMAGGWAHLLELPNKMLLSREEYLTVQQIYRGWALLGIPICSALMCTAVLAVLQRRQRRQCYFVLTALSCIVLSLAIFFSVTYPTNQITHNWTVLPDAWETLRLRWEYSHAAGALLYFIALTSLTLALIAERR